MLTAPARIERTMRPQATATQRIVEFLLPAILAASPYAPVVRGYIPESLSDVIVVVTLLFTVLLITTFAKLPPGLVLLVLLGVMVATLAQRPNLVAVTLVPLIVFGLRCVDIRKVVRTFLIVSAVLFAAVVMSYLIFDFNVGNDVHMWRAYSASFEDRSSLGFTHPNRAMPAWAVIAIGTMAFASPRGRLRWLIPIAVVTGFLYVQSDSRASTLIIAVFIVLAAICRRRVDHPVGPLVRAMAIAAPVALTVVSFAMSLLSTNEEIDTLLSGRPTIYAGLLEAYSVFAPFGTLAVESDIVDSGFLQLVLAKGLFLAAIYLATLTIVVARSRPSWRSVLILAAFLGLSLAETALLNLALLFILLASLEIDRRAAAGTQVGP